MRGAFICTQTFSASIGSLATQPKSTASNDITAKRNSILQVVAPCMCFGACEHQHGTPDQRGADYAEVLETCRSSYSPQTARFPVTKQGRGRNRCKLAPEPEIFGNCNCICAEVLQNRVRLSDVCLSVCLSVSVYYSSINGRGKLFG